MKVLISFSSTKKITLDSLIANYKPKIVAFKNLGVEQQCALIAYMSEGAWDDVVPNIRSQKALFNRVSDFVEAKGNLKFGVVNIPASAMEDALVQTPSFKYAANDAGFDNASDYFEWYRKSNTGLAKYKSDKWPVILSSDKGPLEELLQDGWHRFNAYMHRGLKIIPCLFFVQASR